VLADRVALSVDLYRSHYHNFVGPLQTITPNVFFREDALRQYLLDALRTSGGDSTQLAALAAVLADTASKIPFGVVTPEGVTDPTAVVFASRNYGAITLYGIDLGAQIALTNTFSINGTLSYVDKNFFANLDSVSDLSLNSPKFKYTVALEYRDAGLGVNAEARVRHVDGFPVNSGVFIGSVPAYTVVDLDLGYRLPFVEGLTLSLSAQNLLTSVAGESGSLFTQRHAEFVGTPALGRLVMARVAYEFK
jgi:iron complex outermembrane receptor protein